MQFRQHVPGFCDGVEPHTFTFTTKEELLADPKVAQWTQDNFIGKGPFFRYSLERHSLGNCLMAEYDEGRAWWVVGFIDDAAGLDLPNWVAVPGS